RAPSLRKNTMSNVAHMHDFDEPADLSAGGPLDAYSRCVADVADRVGPSVVRVESGGERRRSGIGSGVIIAGDGLVLTNSHVVSGARRGRLALVDGNTAEAGGLGDEPDHSLAAP